ncbi:hypothetical protein BDV27DRAFT_157718 [Aspergillus caelatus]|uniref:BTB domain-containing protein n=1 Tax=Aspergillus caelatus TaxID=61420 RepID=A0A5N7A3Z9_9EURO|nr:uncharacterized protein BDV27DRAFT_157718 [Aspergillus caelatus]KAE8364574.1 hypothetical protein BDV27DRAFT_157718 [Aspergillus caelatus]
MESAFPQFGDGDVNITIYEDIYQLHSTVLKARSRELRDLLSSLGSYGIGHFGCVQLELVESASHGYGVLEFLDPNDKYRYGPMYMQLQKPIIMWPPEIRLLWANMFKILYGLCPLLDHGGLQNVLCRCWDVVNLADCLRATRTVFPAIVDALRELGPHFYALTAEDPINWIKLGTYMRSALIFKEAAIHVIGNWNALQGDLDYLPSVVHELCESKQAELVEFKQLLEARMLTYCPYTIVPATSCAEDMTTPCVKDFGMWTAMTYYSQWFCMAVAENRTYYARDGGAAFYRAIYTGGDAYLDTEEQATTNAFPMSAYRAKMLDRTLNILKGEMSKFVSVLLVNESHYDPDLMGELPYLTCCKVDDEELPWVTWPDGDWHVDSDEELFLSDYEAVTDSDGDDEIEIDITDPESTTAEVTSADTSATFATDTLPFDTDITDIESIETEDGNEGEDKNTSVADEDEEMTTAE